MRKTFPRRDVEKIRDLINHASEEEVIDFVTRLLNGKVCIECLAWKENSYFYAYRNECNSCHSKNVLRRKHERSRKSHCTTGRS